MSIDTITQLSGCSKCTVNYVLKTYWNYNEVVNPLVWLWGWPRVLDHDDLNFIESVLVAEPSLYLNKIQEKLGTFCDIEMSITTISRTLKQLDQTHKGIAKEAIERDELLWATWQMDIAQYDPWQLIFIDEAGIDDHTNIWRKGWASRGQVCVHWTSFLHGQKYSEEPLCIYSGRHRGYRMHSLSS